MVHLYDAVRVYNHAHPGFDAHGGVPSDEAQHALMDTAIDYAQAAEIPSSFSVGGGYIDHVLAELAKPGVAPDYADLFSQALLHNPEYEPLAKTLEFTLTAIAERSPETWEHLKHHTALSMMAYKHKHGEVTADNALEAMTVMLTALGHDVGKLGIEPHLLHKHTRLDEKRFAQVIDNYDKQVPDYPQKAHDIEFLKQAEQGNLVFGEIDWKQMNEPSTGADINASDEMISFDGAKYSEKHWMSNSERIRIGRILLRIQKMAKAHIDEADNGAWLTEKELKELASQSRGTLNDIEKAIINRHDPMGEFYFQALLARDILPQELRDLPHLVNMDAFRGTHEGEQIAPVAALIHLTDVFEALTANRSYRDAYTVSEALNTMDAMAKAGELDPELLSEFIQSRVWYDYAKQYDRELGDLAQISELMPPEKAENAAKKPSKWSERVREGQNDPEKEAELTV